MNSEDTIDIRQFLAILKRQARLIILIILLVTGAAFLYIVAATPQYTAKTLVYVDPTQKNLLDPQKEAVSSRTEEARLESEVGILKSDAVALETIGALRLIENAEFGPSLSTLDRLKAAVGMESTGELSGEDLLNAALNRFRESTDVRRRGLTYLIEVSGKSSEPETAAELSRGLAETYIQHQLASKVKATQAAGALLESQIENARARLARTESELDGFIDNNIGRIEDAGGVEIAALRARVGRAADRADSLRGELAGIEGSLGDGDLDALIGNLQSDAIAALGRERSALMRRLESSSNDAQVGDLRAALAEVEARLENQAGREIATLRDQLDLAENDQSGLRQTLRERAVTVDLPSDLLADLYQIQQEADIAQRQYTNLLSRSRDLQAQALVQVADSRIVSEALVPKRPSEPNVKLILALALVLGLGLGVGVGFFRDYLLGGVTSTSELSSLLPVEVAGSVPRIEMARGQLSPSDSVIEAPLTGYAESFRQIRATIDQVVPPQSGRGRIVAVTSTIPAEGKTSTSIALARTYDLAGYRTLLIDGDFRKPLVHKHFGLAPEGGLSDFLRNREEIDGVTSMPFYDSDPRSGAGVFLGKSRSNEPTDQLLQSAAFSQLLEQARQEFDIVIVDTSPVLPVVDARFVIPHADAVIFCISYNLVQKSDMREAYRRIEAASRGQIPILTLLNGDESAQSGYKYRGYYSETY